MINDPILLQIIKEFVETQAYPEIIKQIREHYIKQLLAIPPMESFEKRDYYHQLVYVLDDFDKELRKCTDSFKFRG